MLRLYWNQDSNLLLADRYGVEAVPGLESKRGSYFQFQLGLHTPGVDSLFKIPDAGDLRFVAKTSSGATAAVLAIITNADAGVYDSATGLYTIKVVIDSSTLRTLLNFGQTTENEAVTLRAELVWRPDRAVDDDTSAQWNATLPFKLKVWNDLERSDGTLPPTDPPGKFLRLDAAQSFSNAERWQALANLGITYSNGQLIIIDPSGNTVIADVHS